MSEEEAKLFNIPTAERRSYVRMDGAKVNPVPATSAKWFHLIGVPLGNETDSYPGGDNIGVTEPWTPPDMWRDISDAAANLILDEIEAGLDGGKQRYTDAAAATDRAAWKVVLKHLPHLNESQGREIVKTWIRNAVLRREPYHDPEERKDRQGLRVNPGKRPGPRP